MAALIHAEPDDFNPLSPHGERREFFGRKAGIFIFQSTLPAWGETWLPMPEPPKEDYFNPLSPHGERLRGGSHPAPEKGISIHSPRMGRDLTSGSRTVIRIAFQSTLPAWGETSRGSHAGPVSRDFNPLSPHGERLRDGGGGGKPQHFNPLSPHGERPDKGQMEASWRNISIHSPRMGRDPTGRGRPTRRCWISIHSPRMGRDLFPRPAEQAPVISIHSPRMGRDTTIPPK